MVDGHICGAPATTIGHVIRREHGGGDGSDNLRPQCGDCNYGETPKPGAMPATLSYTQAAIVRALDVIGVPVNAGRRRAKGALQRHAWAQSLKPRDLDLACRWRRARGPLVRA
jgi:HNH endonuclease